MSTIMVGVLIGALMLILLVAVITALVVIVSSRRKERAYAALKRDEQLRAGTQPDGS